MYVSIHDGGFDDVIRRIVPSVEVGVFRAVFLHQPIGQLIKGVPPHGLQAEVAGGGFDDDGEVAAGGNGDNDALELDAEDVVGEVLVAEAVVALVVVPLLHLDDEVDALLVEDAAE